MRSYYDAYWSRETPPPTTDPLTPVRRRLMWKLVESQPHLAASHPARLLDCGSGDGSLVMEATSRGLEAVGMDISAVAVERASRRFPGSTILQHSVEQTPWPFPPDSFDLVVAFEVIEHLIRPRALVRGAWDVLKPGGHLALTTPYHGPLKNVALSLVRFDRHFDVEGEHIRFFSDRSLRRMLEDARFRIERKLHLGRAPGLWAGVFVWARKQPGPEPAAH